MSKVVRRQERHKVDDEYLESIAELCANNPEMSFASISTELLGFSEGYIRNLRHKYPQLRKMTDYKVNEKFKEAAIKAQNRIEHLLFAESETVSLQAAKDILSRAGYDAVAKVENTNKEITIELFDDED